jgi:hypothetical protein
MIETWSLLDRAVHVTNHCQRRTGEGGEKEMLKMSKKSLLAIGLLLSIAGGSLAAYAAFWVYSSPAGPVRISYVATVSTSYYPTIWAQATNNGGAVSGATVYLYYSNVTIGGSPLSFPTGWTYWGSNTTDSTGWCSFKFNAPFNGNDYYFEAKYYVP